MNEYLLTPKQQESFRKFKKSLPPGFSVELREWGGKICGVLIHQASVKGGEVAYVNLTGSSKRKFSFYYQKGNEVAKEILNKSCLAIWKNKITF